MSSPFEREAALFDAASACLNYALERCEERTNRDSQPVLSSEDRMSLLEAKACVQKIADDLYARRPPPEPESETA